MSFRTSLDSKSMSSLDRRASGGPARLSSPAINDMDSPRSDTARASRSNSFFGRQTTSFTGIDRKSMNFKARNSFSFLSNPSKSRMASFFIGDLDTESFFIDGSATEVEKDVKKAPWFRSLSRYDQKDIGIAYKKDGDSDGNELTLDVLVGVDLNPFHLGFSNNVAESDFREKYFYKLQGERPFENFTVLLIELGALAYDLVVITGECDDPYPKLAASLILNALFVFGPSIFIVLRPNVLAMLGTAHKSILDGLVLGLSVGVSSLSKVLFLECAESRVDAFQYILIFMVLHTISKSSSLHVLFQSLLFAVFFVLMLHTVMLFLNPNLWMESPAAALVCALMAIIFYGVGFYSREKMARTYYLVDAAKKIQLVKIKDTFKAIKSNLRKKKSSSKEKYELDIRSPIEKSLGILKTLRETDEGRRLEEELEFVIQTLKKSENKAWTPELLNTGDKSKPGDSDSYQSAVKDWLVTYKNDENVKYAKLDNIKTDVRSRVRSRTEYARPSSKSLGSPSEMQSVQETKEEKDEDGPEFMLSPDGEIIRNKKRASATEQNVAEKKIEYPAIYIENPDKLKAFFELPEPSNIETIQSLALNLKPYTPVGKFFAQSLGKWDLDLFKLAQISNEKPLLYMVMFCIRDLGLDNTFKMKQENLFRFADIAQRGYRENPYHNATHAADVLHNMYCLIKAHPLSEILTPLEKLACLYAAIIHDFDHPGVNNALMISTSSYQSYLYHDKSVLENYHISCGFAASRGDSNVFENLKPEEFARLRALVIELVLATDMKSHFELISRFNSTYNDDEDFDGPESSRFMLNMDDPGDRQLILKIGMKVCDIAHSTKNKDLHLKWSSNMQEEFWLQGDKERDLELPVSPLMERQVTRGQTAHSQIGFLEVVCQPLYESWCRFVPEFDFVLQSLEANKKMWQDIEEEENANSAGVKKE